MLTKNTAKLVKELHEKKHRNEHKLFLVEGEKNVAELIGSNFEIRSIFVTTAFFEKYKESITKKKAECTVVEQREIENIGTLEANSSALAIVHQKKNTPFTHTSNDIVLALDNIRDKGNLGTIIRIADWYGITKIIASESTTDQYSSKAISASMGSFARVSIFYTDLEKFLENANVPIFGTFLEGESVHTTRFPTGGILVMDSESRGISDALLPHINKKITIPSFGKAESLNVAIATAIILDNWKR